MAAPEYDQIGIGYGSIRLPDPRLEAVLWRALGDAQTILNVGAGAGSYEPPDRDVVAVEPSSVMLAQHPGVHRVLGVAESLPFPDDCFEAAMAVLTVHHWSDIQRGLAEMRRVSHCQVVFTWDPDFERELWVVEEYVPEIGVFERSRFTPLATVVDALGAHTVETFEVPHDYSDGFQAAYWRRPECYLDPVIRSASSTFASLPDEVVNPGIDQLRRDLESGVWARRHRDLLSAEALDCGHRVIVAG